MTKQNNIEYSKKHQLDIGRKYEDSLDRSSNMNNVSAITIYNSIKL